MASPPAVAGIAGTPPPTNARLNGSGLGLVPLLASLLLVVVVAGSGSAMAQVHPWREICWLPAEDVSFAGLQMEGQGAAVAAHVAQAQRARVAIEVNGLRGRLRVQMTAPFEMAFTTENFGLGSLSLRAGATTGGLLQVEQPGVVRLTGISGDGRTIDVEAGSLIVRGLPLRCEDLAAIPSQRAGSSGGGSHRVTELQRLYLSASPSALSFAVTPGADLVVTVPAKPRGEWTRINYAAAVDGKAAFVVSGWARKPKLRAGGGNPGAVAAAGAGPANAATGAGGSLGGSLAADGFRACAPALPVAPTDFRLATLPPETLLYESAQGEKVWTKLTSPLRGLVARYPGGRSALAGMPGWSWPSWKCETAWVDAEVVSWPDAEAPDAGSKGQ